MTYFYCLAHGAEPAAKDVLFAGLLDDCIPSVTPCGHRLAAHRPSDPRDASNHYDATGFFTDPKLDTTGGREYHLFSGIGPEDPVQYTFRFHTGEITGFFPFSITAFLPPPNHIFLTPSDSPPADCESHDRCTLTYRLRVLVPGLEELPLSRDYWLAGDGGPLYWTRCGLISDCPTSRLDLAYNLPGHPSVHWGVPEFNQALTALAVRWFSQCSRFDTPDVGPPHLVEPANLVISDLSLPAGGLLDYRGDWRKPHGRHRRGTDADMAGTSVVTTGGFDACGTVRPASTYSREWDDTPLRELAEEVGLETLVPGTGSNTVYDPGHVWIPE